jgi:hypothetical protein
LVEAVHITVFLDSRQTNGGQDIKGALMIALNCADGSVAWKTLNPRGWKMSHASILPYTFQGRHLYLYVALEGVVAVDAKARFGFRGGLPTFARIL